MATDRSSNQVRSKAAGGVNTDRRLNIVYWMRIAAGVAAGLLSGYIERQPAGSALMPIVVFIVTIGIAKAIMGSTRSKKIYYHGIGGYVIWWFVAFVVYLSIAAVL